MDEGGVRVGEDGEFTEDGGVSLTLLTVGLLGGDEGLGVEGGGDQGLGVEGGGDTVVDGSHGKPGVGHTEAGGVSDVLDGLQLVGGIDVGVSTGHTAVGVADLVLHAVEVGVAVVQLSELVLGVELGAGVGGHGGGVGGGSVGSGVGGGSVGSDGSSSGVGSHGRGGGGGGISHGSLGISVGGGVVGGVGVGGVGQGVGQGGGGSGLLGGG